MKKLIINTVIIFSLALLLEGLLIGIVCHVERSVSYKLPKEKTILVAGDSSCECAINPEYFSSAVNVASSGTATLFTYMKIRKFVEENPQIDKVVISCQPNTFISKSWLSIAFTIKIPAYISLLEKNEVADVLDNKYFYIGLLKTPFQEFGATLRIIYKKLQGLDTSYQELNIGRFRALNGSIITENQQKKTLLFDRNDIIRLHQLYFDKIIQYLNDKEVEVILLNTPKYVDIIGFDEFMQEEYPGIRYLNYSACQWDKKFFKDVDHLNVLGAKKFTALLKESLLLE